MRRAGPSRTHVSASSITAHREFQFLADRSRRFVGAGAAGSAAIDPVLLAADTAAELQVAADSAADEAVLEELADAHPRGDDDAGRWAAETIPGGAEALANAVTWDIDVETFNNHARVQYYLDFFQGRGRQRMAIWLSRMPRYEAIIRERLQQEGLPGDLVYLALIESGFSNTATSRAKAVGMWQFMKATGKGYGLRIDSWVDERRDPMRATDAAVKHLRGPEPALQLAVSRRRGIQRRIGQGVSWTRETAG